MPVLNHEMEEWKQSWFWDTNPCCIIHRTFSTGEPVPRKGHRRSLSTCQPVTREGYRACSFSTSSEPIPWKGDLGFSGRRQNKEVDDGQKETNVGWRLHVDEKIFLETMERDEKIKSTFILKIPVTIALVSLINAEGWELPTSGTKWS